MKVRYSGLLCAILSIWAGVALAKGTIAHSKCFDSIVNASLAWPTHPPESEEVTYERIFSDVLDQIQEGLLPSAQMFCFFGLKYAELFGNACQQSAVGEKDPEIGGTYLESRHDIPARVTLKEDHPPGLPAEASSSECESLLDLYRATNGWNWRNQTGWEDVGSLRRSCCSGAVHGVGCSADSAHVTSLVLTSNNLEGEIPPSIGGLQYLVHLYLLYDSHFRCPGWCSDLRIVPHRNLAGNAKLGGSLPPEIGLLRHIARMQVDEAFPARIAMASFSDLRIILRPVRREIWECSLTSIPREIGLLTELTYL